MKIFDIYIAYCLFFCPEMKKSFSLLDKSIRTGFILRKVFFRLVDAEDEQLVFRVSATWRYFLLLMWWAY